MLRLSQQRRNMYFLLCQCQCFHFCLKQIKTVVILNKKFIALKSLRLTTQNTQLLKYVSKSQEMKT